MSLAHQLMLLTESDDTVLDPSSSAVSSTLLSELVLLPAMTLGIIGSSSSGVEALLSGK